MASLLQSNHQRPRGFSDHNAHAPFGWQFLNNPNLDQELSSYFYSESFHQPSEDSCGSISSDGTQSSGPEPKSPRCVQYVQSNHQYYTSPLRSVPSHQILLSQMDSKTAGTNSLDETTSLPWGTDPSFGPSGYSPHPDIPNQDIMEDELTQIYFNFLDFSVGNPTIQDHDLVEVQVDKRERGKNEGGNGPTSKRRRQHILSERNRRTQQSKLYDEICSLIPGVCPKRCTKSELLMRAAGWLGDLTEGNRKLKEQLACLSSDRGYS